MREIAIDFTNLDHMLLMLKSLKVCVSKSAMLSIIEIHTSTKTVIGFMPIADCAGICYRAANKILDLLTADTGMKFKRFKKHNYELY